MRETGRGSRLGAYWKDHPEGAEQDINRDSNALGSARPSRYGLSSPTNFPPARSARSPGGFHPDDHPGLYDSPVRGRQDPVPSRGSSNNPSRNGASASSRNGSNAPSRTAFLWETSRARPASDTRTTDSPHIGAASDPAELERLYRIAAGQKEPSFADAVREGPWPRNVLRRRAFLLFLAECAVYAGCFRWLLDPFTILTARLGFPLSPIFTAAGVSLAGTLGCSLFYPLFRERRMLLAAWRWMAAAAALLLLLVQFLLWGEVQAQWTVLRFCGFFLLGPLTVNGTLACVLLYAHWRLEHPRPRKRRKKETEEAAEEADSGEEEGRRRDGGDRKAESGRGGRDRNRTGREENSREGNPAALDRNGWNRNLSVSRNGGWERGSGWERYAQSDRSRWRQTEAERDGRRQAESVRNKWK